MWREELKRTSSSEKDAASLGMSCTKNFQQSSLLLAVHWMIFSSGLARFVFVVDGMPVPLAVYAESQEETRVGQFRKKHEKRHKICIIIGLICLIKCSSIAWS